MNRSNVRLAFHLLSLLFLSLSLLALNSRSFAQAPAQVAGFAALDAGPQAGWVASGEATVTTSRGTETGPVSISTWGADHCRIAIDLSRPGEPRRYEVVLAGARAHVTGPQDLTRALVAPGWREGCALLPQGLLVADLSAGRAVVTQTSDGKLLLDRTAGASGAPSLTLNPQGLPASLTWQSRRGETVVVTFADYQHGAGAAYPATVTEAVAGTTLLQLHLTTLSAHPGFAETDFALPAMPPPRHVSASAGGGQ